MISVLSDKFYQTSSRQDIFPAGKIRLFTSMMLLCRHCIPRLPLEGSAPSHTTWLYLFISITVTNIGCVFTLICAVVKFLDMFTSLLTVDSSRSVFSKLIEL